MSHDDNRSAFWRASGARTLLACVLVCCAPAERAGAQRLSGHVRDAVSGQPVAGAVIVLLGEETLPSRTISNGNGHYTVPLPPRARWFRVTRIGYRPFEIDLGAGTPAFTRDVQLSRLPSLLADVQVTAQTQCPPTDDSREALALWEQARSALLASVVAREALPALATTLTFERILRPSDSLVLQQTMRVRSGRTDRPFRAPAAASTLIREGFLVRAPSGDHFSAPDADVLIDDDFAASHCFTVARRRRDEGDLLGLGFRPAPGRDSLVDVRGTLWLDPTARTLQTLEFRYTGLSEAALEAGAGGAIRFLSLPNGVIVIDRWSVLLPAIERQANARRGAASERVVQLHETGGALLSATWTDSLKWNAPLPTIVGEITSRGARETLESVVVTLTGTPDSAVTTSAGRFQIGPVLPGRYLVRATDTTFARFASPRIAEEVLLVAELSARPVALSLPDRATVLGSDCDQTKAASGTATVAGHIGVRGGTAADLSLSARWAGRFIAAAVEEAGVDIQLQPEGRFTLCEVARERPVRLHLFRGANRIADTTLTVPGHQSVAVVDWLVAPPAIISGIVRRAFDDAPLPGVDVWFPALDRRAVTDSYGGFRLADVPSGPQLIQLRRVGYLALRDSLTITTAPEQHREYVLLPQSAQLDTVRTVADRTRNLSPALRGFEDRRSRGIGRFIGEADLRANEREALSAIALSRMPGLALVRGPAGSAYLASTRKACANGALSQTCTPCFVTVFIDGGQVYAANAKAGPPPDVGRIRAADLAGVEFYADGASAPAAYSATGSGCGTLLIWTRER
jgi:hypothetical protein